MCWSKRLSPSIFPVTPVYVHGTVISSSHARLAAREVLGSSEPCCREDSSLLVWWITLNVIVHVYWSHRFKWALCALSYWQWCEKHWMKKRCNTYWISLLLFFISSCVFLIISRCRRSPSNRRQIPNVVIMLFHCLQRWLSISPALYESLFVRVCQVWDVESGLVRLTKMTTSIT